MTAIAVAVLIIGALVFSQVSAYRSETAWPLERSGAREKLLTFGLHVTPDPETNPIDPPERFTGFHSALDLEILKGEENKDVPVYAVCAGEVVTAAYAEGYGGVIVHRCTLDGQPVTVLYGHISRESFTVKPGDTVTKGQKLASLAAGRTVDSGENRKHLHLGIHKGEATDMLGYVQEEAALKDFIDPQSVLP